jgi:Fic-DOC domain mobile mystery protein B
VTKIKFASFGQTPIDEDEKSALIPELDTLDDLNIFEQENIIEAQKWIGNSNAIKKSDPLDLDFLTKLHKKMFDKTWEWAGQLRKTDKNIGCDPTKIRIELRNLQDDLKFWLDKKTYSIVQIALVIHHRLVKIHIFPNGNGRHARLVADCIVKKFEPKNKIDWSGKNLQRKKFKSVEELRKNYISSLSKADHGDYRELFGLFDV